MTQKLGLADKEFEITVINRLKKIEEKMGKWIICNLCETHFMYKDKEMLKVKGCKKDKTCQSQTNKNLICLCIIREQALKKEVLWQIKRDLS